MLDDLQNPLFIKWTGISAAFGALLSFIISLIAGAGFPALLYRPFLYGFIMGVVAAVSYFIIKLFIPEIISEFLDENYEDAELDISKESENLSNHDSELDLTKDKNKDSDNIKSKTNESSLIDENLDLGTQSSSNAPSARVKPKKEDKVTDEEVIVQGVTLKNEPQLMAEAIRDLMERDE